ncbi:hypothetical protein ACFC00_22750 [Streptomyces adustus]|uniref:hypothetical protein n=1 Tax=Streptomyces adustus TaxID=1609272 RepID=UPI0035D91CE8
MTAQIPDEVLFEGRRFALTAVDGGGLFDPAGHGLETRPGGTACYRGHICRYTTAGQRLTLQDLELGSEHEPPPLCGVRPRQDAECLEWRYRRPDLPMSFTGRLLIGTGDVADSPYLNMGFRPAWMYSDVRELTFRDGRLLTATDHSAELAAVRSEAAPGPVAGEPTGQWISRTFSLSYDYSWPGHS